MSPHLHHEITHAGEPEIASPTISAQHGQNARAITGLRRIVRRNLVPAVAALGVCLGATAALTGSGGHANPRPVTADGRVSGQQLARRTAALEAKGYVQVACTAGGGTLMRNHHTGQSVIVRS